MVSPMCVLGILIAILAPLAVGFAAELRVYEHNGSLIHWSVDQGTITATYHAPRTNLQEAGVRPGTPFFEGSFEQEGGPGEDLFSGKAYTFKSGCEPTGYDVIGSKEGKQIVLLGPAPIWSNTGCEITGYSATSVHAKLVLTRAEVATRKISYATWFLKSGCDWDKVYAEGQKKRSPYPDDLLDYAPPAKEYTEFLWSDGGCPKPKNSKRATVVNFQSAGAPGNVPSVKLPKGFSCRLDRLVFIERKSRKRYDVQGAYFDAAFQYVKGSGASLDHTGAPLPLKEDFYRRASTVQVKVTVGGKPYILSNEDIMGSPAHVEWAFEPKDWEASDPDDLPVVTDRNADHFAFDPSSQWPIIDVTP